MAQRTKTKARTTKARTGTRRKSASTVRRSTAAKRAAAGRKGGRAQARSRARSTARSGLRKVSAAIAQAAREMRKLVAGQDMPADAVALLEHDHREVEAMFEQYEQLESKAEKAKLAAKICMALTVHTTIEEELLYPPAHEEIEEDLVDEAIVEHNSAKQLIAEIEAMKPSDHLYDAKVKVLGEYVKHHVKEEESEMFPQLESSGMDLRDLGRELAERKSELLAQLAGKA